MKDELTSLLENKCGKTNSFQQYVLVQPEVKTLEIMLEDTPYYAEWIKGEGADISIYRAIDNDRVVGALLPLRNFNGKLPVEII